MVLATALLHQPGMVSETQSDVCTRMEEQESRVSNYLISFLLVHIYASVYDYFFQFCAFHKYNTLEVLWAQQALSSNFGLPNHYSM